MNEQGLNNFFKFDEADLMANRENCFSESKIKILTEVDRESKKACVGKELIFIAQAPAVKMKMLR